MTDYKTVTTMIILNFIAIIANCFKNNDSWLDRLLDHDQINW